MAFKMKGSPYPKGRIDRLAKRYTKAKEAGKDEKAERIKGTIEIVNLQQQERRANRAERPAKPFTGHKEGTMETLNRLQDPKKWQTRHAVKQAVKGAVGIAALGLGISGLFKNSPQLRNMWRWKK